VSSGVRHWPMPIGTGPVAIFQETFFYLLEKVRSSIPTKDTAEMVRLIDATPIDLNLNQFQWAEFRSTKAGIKLHTVYDPEAEVPVYFEMTTAKVNNRKALTKLPMMPGMTYVVDRATMTMAGIMHWINKVQLLLGG
jgi:putative transposase